MSSSVAIAESQMSNGSVQRESTTLLPYEKMISACAGALLTSLLVTPLDVVKTRIQSQPPLSSSKLSKQSIPTFTSNLITCSCREVFFGSGDAFAALCRRVASQNGTAMSTQPIVISKSSQGDLACALAPEVNVGARASNIGNITMPTSNQLRFNGTWDGMTKIVRHEGLTSLWKGLSPTLAMSIPATVIYFVGYDYLREEMIRNMAPPSHPSAPLLSGALSRTIAATIISPIELLRTRMQSVEAANKSFQQIIQDIGSMVRTSGPKSLWRGLTPTLLRDVPFSAIYWGCYEYIKPKLSITFSNSSSPSTFQNFQTAFFSGAFAGTIAATITTPFDVIKTTKQVSKDLPTSSVSARVQKDGTLKLARNIVEAEGYKGLFKGLSPRIAKVAPACAIMISSYELGKIFFSHRNDHNR